MERELAPGIVTDPEILGGRPIVKGHRIAVSQLLGQIAGGMTVEEVREDYALTEAEMLAALCEAGGSGKHIVTLHAAVKTRGAGSCSPSVLATSIICSSALTPRASASS